MKKLCKSKNNKVLCGVCGGLSNYIGLDATIIRILCLIFGLTGVGFVVYLITAIIMPESDEF